MGIEKYLKEMAELVNEALRKYLPAEGEYPQAIHKAMRYSSLADGKRLRPILVIASCQAVGGDEEVVMPFACAIELIHTYSLIHDDLPAMDNADLRRGRPTNHSIFGEAMAILAGDGLLTYAFYLMSGLQRNISPHIQLSLINEVSKAIGTFGLIGGQVVDIESENETVGREVMEYIHKSKTGALIKASVLCGAVLGGGNEGEIDSLCQFAEKIGLAFQIIDDILDEEGEKEIMGKTVGGDKKAKKSTYPAIFGVKASREKAVSLAKEASDLLLAFKERGSSLREIANYIIRRDR